MNYTGQRLKNEPVNIKREDVKETLEVNIILSIEIISDRFIHIYLYIVVDYYNVELVFWYLLVFQW